MRPRVSYANIVSSICLFLILGGGAAYALDGSNTVFSDDIVDGEVKAADVGQGAVGSPEVKNNALTGADIAPNTLGSGQITDGSLTGADIDESTLGQVPSARLGGVGRLTPPQPLCDPNSVEFVTCAHVTVNLPAQTRVLLVGAVRASTEIDSDTGIGDCRIGTSFNRAFPGSPVRVVATDSNIEFVPLTAVTPPLGPGEVTFGVDCNEIDPGDTAIRYAFGTISAVAISPS
jgi:hypothetical protein